MEQLIQQAISQERKRELDLYQRYASDPEFKRAFDASVMRFLSLTDSQQLDGRVLEAGIKVVEPRF